MAKADPFCNRAEVYEAYDDVPLSPSDRDSIWDIILKRYSRRAVLRGSLGVAAAAVLFGPAALASGAANLQVNLQGLDNCPNTGFRPFLDWIRLALLDGASGLSPALTVSGTTYGGTDLYDQGWVDANYDLINPLPAGATNLQIMFHRRGSLALTYLPSLEGYQFKITWDGGGAVTGIDIDPGQVLGTTNRFATYTEPAGDSAAPQGGFGTGNDGFTFHLNPALGGPPTNIKMFLVANQNNVTPGEIFDPTWLKSVSQWKVLRLMDWMMTNDSPAVDYADFPTESFRYWNQDAITKGRKVGVPVSVITKLGQQTGCGIWVNVPHQFTDAAVTSFATALRDANLSMVFVEHSNEDWNTQFAQTTYMQTQGAAISAWSADNNYHQGWKFGGLRAARVMAIFRSVFGTDSGTRWTGVLATQTVNGSTTVSNDKFIGVQYYLDNEAAGGTTLAKLFTHVACTTYFGVGATDPTLSIEPDASISAWIDDSLSRYAAHQEPAAYTYFNRTLYAYLMGTSDLYYWRAEIALAATKGLTVMAYEGGNGSACTKTIMRDDDSGVGAKFNLAFANWALSPECAVLEEHIANTFVSDGGVTPSKYTATGLVTKYGPWTMQQYLTDYNEVYRALQKFNGSSPKGRLR